jgi:seryl-tRNA synthetase
MTLDITQFIDSKGGNAEEIRESQRKRGDSVELVDEIIQMYAEWVKSAYVDLAERMELTLYHSGFRNKWAEQESQCSAEGDQCKEKGVLHWHIWSN